MLGIGEKKRREMRGANWEGCKGKSPESQCGSSPTSPPAGNELHPRNGDEEGKMVQRSPDPSTTLR